MELQTVRKIIKSGEVSHSRALIDAAYSLTIDQKRIVWLFLMSPNEDAGITVDNELGVMEFELKAYSSFYNVSTHEASRDVIKALRDFSSSEVVFYIDDESTESDNATDEMSWLSKKSYRPNRGSYIVYFNPYLLPYLKQMSNNVTPRFMELDKLKNPAHVRLYLKLLENNDDREVEININWMLERFNLPSTYGRYSNFKQRFLLSSINAIVKLVGMENLNFSEIHTGKKTTSILFKW